MTEPNQSRGEWLVNLLNNPPLRGGRYVVVSLSQIFENLADLKSPVTRETRHAVLQIAKYSGETSRLDIKSEPMNETDRKVMIDVLREFEKDNRIPDSDDVMSLAQIFENLADLESPVARVTRYVVLHIAKLYGETPRLNIKSEPIFYRKSMNRADREVMIDILRKFEMGLRENAEDARILDEHEARILAQPDTRGDREFMKFLTDGYWLRKMYRTPLMQALIDVYGGSFERPKVNEPYTWSIATGFNKVSIAVVNIACSTLSTHQELEAYVRDSLEHAEHTDPYRPHPRELKPYLTFKYYEAKQFCWTYD